MPYRMRFRIDVEYVGVGQGAMGVPSAQKQTVVDVTTNQVPGGGTGNAINAADITTLLNALTTDASAQLNASPTLGNMQAWISGGG